MKKLILGVLAAGALTSAQAHGGFGRGFAFGAASGLFVGAAVTAPWAYDSYYPYYGYGPYYGYRSYDYYPSAYYYYNSTPAYSTVPAATTQVQPAAPAQTQQPTTVINNYNYYNSTPMSGANSLFGR